MVGIDRCSGDLAETQNVGNNLFGASITKGASFYGLPLLFCIHRKKLVNIRSEERRLEA